MESVAELQGWYGPLALSERFIQMLWTERPWGKRELHLWDGGTLQVLSAGSWNHGSGPDFIRAKLAFDGRIVQGDVEIHLYPEDWARHGHHSNPGFNDVLLHVCVFPPVNPGLECRTLAGRELPLWLMAPYLPGDLEHLVDHFREDERQHWRMELQDAFASQTATEILEDFVANARERFRSKVAFAGWLVQRDGWEQACHELVLGYLGIPGNRAAMLSCAQRYSWQEMAEPDFSVKAAVEYFSDKWRKKSSRPANRPICRLEQYCRLLRDRGDWMRRWQEFDFRQWRNTAEPCEAGFRQEYNLKEKRIWLQSELWSNIWTGSRFDSLVVDVLLPLKQSQHRDIDCFPIWFNWWAGDWPDAYPIAINGLNLPKPQRRNGYFQALFEWIVNRQSQSI